MPTIQSTLFVNQYRNILTGTTDRGLIQLNKKTPDKAYAVLLPTAKHATENGKLTATQGEYYGDSHPLIQAAAPPTNNPPGPISETPLE
jgi:hypothetical protein